MSPRKKKDTPENEPLEEGSAAGVSAEGSADGVSDGVTEEITPDAGVGAADPPGPLEFAEMKRKLAEQVERETAAKDIAPAAEPAVPPQASDDADEAAPEDDTGSDDDSEEASLPPGHRDLAGDADLVKRHADGDPSAFEEIVRAHESRVYAVAYRMVGNSEDARDVSQEVFINAFRALPRFRVEAPLSVWFYRSTVNSSINLLRRRKPVTSIDDAEYGLADDNRSPDDLALAADTADAVHEALEILSEEFRAVIVLRDLEDLDYAEVATALDIPIGTVRSRLHRARAQLAEILRPYRDAGRMA
jgi:RNA polymerase sigma-70 factor, ECF subfamily